MKRSLLLSVFAVAVCGGIIGTMTYNQITNPGQTVHADNLHADARGGGSGGGSQPAGPSAVGAWFGIARPCPTPVIGVTAGTAGDDSAHTALCTQICGQCAFQAGALPPEVPMMPQILADGNVVVNDAGSVPVFHTTASGVYAADPDPSQPQIPGRTRYQASFVWIQGTGGTAFENHPPIGGTNAAFFAVARPRFVVYFDPNNPDVMFGYIQPHLFPIVGSNGLVTVIPPSSLSPLVAAFEGNHLIAPVSPLESGNNFLGPLPAGCDTTKGCLGTYHFTIHRINANVPNFAF
jgi:hypothetical protein